MPDLTCPLPLDPGDRVMLAHGGGGRAMRRLLKQRIQARFGADCTAHDGALLQVPGGVAAFTTDSFVVSPLFFPGGDLGRLAVCGTVNDLAMCGAVPVGLSLSLILEEGMPLTTLDRLLDSVARTAEEAGVTVVTGDTKVVERGKADGVFMNTAGVGRLLPGADVHPRRVHPGDAILLSGDLGRHGVAVMCARAGLGLHVPIESDCAPLTPAVNALFSMDLDIHCLRDPTRGGLVAALHEIAEGSGHSLEIEEQAVPLLPEVAAACELLGLDPLHLACEGRLLCFVPEAQAERALNLLRAVPVSQGAIRIGTVRAQGPGPVLSRGPWGNLRHLDLPDGELLPRIC